MQRLCAILSVSASLFAGAVFVSGCSNGSDDGSTTGSGTNGNAVSEGQSESVESRGTIGFSALTLKNPFFKIIADSITEGLRSARQRCRPRRQ